MAAAESNMLPRLLRWRRAADALLANRPIPQKQQPSIGCNIKWKK